MILHFDIEPTPKERPRFSRKTKSTYTPRKTKTFEQLIAELGKLQIKTPFNCAISVEVDFYITKPKTVKREFPTARKDIDNMQKSLFDGLNGIAWVDDCLICEVTARKHYAKRGHICLKIKEL